MHQLLRNAAHVHTRACTHSPTASSPYSGSTPKVWVEEEEEDLTSKSPLRALRCRLHEVYAGDLDRRQKTLYNLMILATIVADINGRGSTIIFRVVPFSPTSLLPWSMQGPPSPLRLPRGRSQTRAPPRPHSPHHSLHGGHKNKYMLRGWQHTYDIKPHALFFQIRGFLVWHSIVSAPRQDNLRNCLHLRNETSIHPPEPIARVSPDLETRKPCPGTRCANREEQRVKAIAALFSYTDSSAACTTINCIQVPQCSEPVFYSTFTHRNGTICRGEFCGEFRWEFRGEFRGEFRVL